MGSCQSPTFYCQIIITHRHPVQLRKMFKNKTNTIKTYSSDLFKTIRVFVYFNMSDLSATVNLIRGRTAKSKNAVHLGFRCSQDGKLRKDGSQSWRCVKKDETLVQGFEPHGDTCNSIQPRS